MPINEYLKQVKQRFNSGISTEHSYRADLQNLILKLVDGIIVTNEPKRQKCGAPDYILQRKQVPIGYIEAKDIGIDLAKIEKSDQMSRYLKSLDNLILTDYLSFRFYRFGQKIKEIDIARIQNGKIIICTDNLNSFLNHIKDFCSFNGQTIKSAEKLAQMMAQKARMLEEVLYNAVTQDDEDNTLQEQLKAFRLILIHDLDEKTFADIYAQTIAYGLFAARLNDPTLDDFSRHEARDLIPKTNPFLRNLFDYISGAQLDERAKWIVDDLADIYRAADLKKILSDFGKSTEQNDPFIHFYETFLSEYNPKLRKSRGVYYTPEPVVNFIVRAVDDVLKTEFGFAKGLADTSKVKIKIDTTVEDQRSKTGYRQIEKEIHKIQILDPATGTGTFLAETIKHIYKNFKGQEGLWSSYVDNHLIPRLNGFEFLMAPYTMCHLKIDMLLRETGYRVKDEKTQKRLNVFLTNSLEEAHPDTGTLFASWLSKEATDANYVKRDTPVMVVLGNPPYSGESKNKNIKWMDDLMKDYKKEPGGGERLDEKNSKWINDDYVKFLRYGQYLIEKNGEGILAFINPHGFLDNPTFRGMRWNLLKTYDKIYILDLHGNSKKKEVCPDGSVDENVFDIQQGVSINIFVKTGKTKGDELGKVFHCDLYGKREDKYDFLVNKSLKIIPYSELPYVKPNYFFIKKDYSEQKMYNQYILVSDIFKIGNSGVVSKRDKLNIHNTKNDVIQMLHDVVYMEEGLCRNKYSIPDDVRDWNFTLARKDIIDSKSNPNLVQKINYRPFDKRFFYYSGKSKGVVGWCVPVVSEHLKHDSNFGLMLNKKIEVGEFRHVLIYRGIVESHAVSMKEINYVFPLYLYNRSEDQEINNKKCDRTPNINIEIIKQISETLVMTFSEEKEEKETSFSPLDILDYIYAILHSPSYREKYKEFLKIDFPRVPYPENKETFWKLVKLGSELRTIHLLENKIVEKPITSYPVDGSNKIDKLLYKDKKVYINNEQYFDKVPEIAWNFYIGGYQPAQKWLKDRKGRELTFEDILHYQKIIVALTHTDKIMKEIDKVIEF